MDFNITTPAIIFPSISFLLIAFTNRFLALASLIRDLKVKYSNEHKEILILQITNLRKRIKLIRWMQGVAIMGMILALLSILALYFDNRFLGHLTFIAAVIAILISLGIGLTEIFFSGRALDLELQDIELDLNSKKNNTNLF